MSLLDNLPHECTIQRKTRSADSMGGSSDTAVIEYTAVPCWEQKVNASEINEYERRGMKISHKVYFTTNYELTERHEIIITKRNGTAVSEARQFVLTVISVPEPDASAGFEFLWRVMCDQWTPLR